MVQTDISDGEKITATGTTANRYPFNLNMSSGLMLYLGSGGAIGNVGSQAFALVGSQIFPSGTVRNRVFGYAEVAGSMIALSGVEALQFVGEWRVYSNVNGSESVIKTSKLAAADASSAVTKLNFITHNHMLTYHPNGSEVGSGFEIRYYLMSSGTSTVNVTGKAILNELSLFGA